MVVIKVLKVYDLQGEQQDQQVQLVQREDLQVKKDQELVKGR
jgi:hypothetical protein|tara:strand:+ start:469 stop:594 length:126 start_codon:yes stop_codon:yes gene_type:complete